MRIISVLVLAMLWAGAALALPDMEGVEFVKCYDGDTCTFAVAGEHIKVRLLGIDAPEIGKRARCPKEQKLALAAKRYLEWHLKRAKGSGKRIDLVNVQPGLYRRLLARVLVGGKDLSRAAVAKGRVRIYDGGKRRGWCGT